MKFAYADPPYLGYGKFYAELHPDALDWDDIETHRQLVERLMTEFSDGWAMSMTSGNLHDILPLVPKTVRVGAWVKPFCSFKMNVTRAYAWEPFLFHGGRKRTKEQGTVRDWVAASITIKRGLVGAKPRDFCRHIFEILNIQRGDEFVDIFPGSGAVQAAFEEWVGGNDAPAQFNLTA